MNMEDLEAAEAAAGDQPGGQDGGGESQTAGTTARVWSDGEWREWNSHWWSSREWDPWSSSHWNGMSVRESGGPSQAAGGSDPQARDHSGGAAAAAEKNGEEMNGGKASGGHLLSRKEISPTLPRGGVGQTSGYGSGR